MNSRQPDRHGLHRGGPAKRRSDGPDSARRSRRGRSQGAQRREYSDGQYCRRSFSTRVIDAAGPRKRWDHAIAPRPSANGRFSTAQLPRRSTRPARAAHVIPTSKCLPHHRQPAAWRLVPRSLTAPLDPEGGFRLPGLEGRHVDRVVAGGNRTEGKLAHRALQVAARSL